MGTRQDLSYVVLSEAGEVLGGKGYDRLAGPASVAKVMTAFVASDVLDRFDKNLSQKIPIPSSISFAGAARFRSLRSGQNITAGQALTWAGNRSDAKSTVALAVYAGRLLLANEKGIKNPSRINEQEAYKRFVLEMNNKAQSLGADNTFFYNATGMPVKSGQLGNRTTAREMGRIFQAFIKAHPRYSDRALGQERLRVPGGRIGGHSLPGLRRQDLAKTGTTNFAGKTLAIDTTSNAGKPISVVIFGARNSGHRQRVLNEARTVADNAFAGQTVESSSVPKAENQQVRSGLGEERNLIASFVKAARRKTESLTSTFSAFAERLERVTKPYIIRAGDSLSKIAQSTKISVTELMAQNDSITDPNKIQVGDTINVGLNNVFSLVVRAGDTVSGLAQKAGTSVKDLLALNDLKNPDFIRQGSSLFVAVNRPEFNPSV